MSEREPLPTDTRATTADIWRIWARLWGNCPPIAIATLYAKNECKGTHDLLDLTQKKEPK